MALRWRDVDLTCRDADGPVHRLADQRGAEDLRAQDGQRPRSALGAHPATANAALTDPNVAIAIDGVAEIVADTRTELAHEGIVTLIEKCSGAVGFDAVATEHRWVVHISGGSVGRGDLTPDREAVGHLGSPFGRAEQIEPSRV
jgi:hypothetical protein